MLCHCHQSVCRHMDFCVCKSDRIGRLRQHVDYHTFFSHHCVGFVEIHGFFVIQKCHCSLLNEFDTALHKNNTIDGNRVSHECQRYPSCGTSNHIPMISHDRWNFSAPQPWSLLRRIRSGPTSFLTCAASDRYLTDSKGQDPWNSKGEPVKISPSKMQVLTRSHVKLCQRGGQNWIDPIRKQWEKTRPC